MDSSPWQDSAAPEAQVDRRDVLQWAACLSAACLSGPLTLANAQAPLTVHKYSRTLLVDKFGRPFKSRRIGFSNALFLPHGAPNTALDGPRRV